MILSYLMQTSIAILSLAIIATYQLIKLLRSNRHPPPTARNNQCRHSHSYPNKPYTNPQPVASPHLRNFHRFLAEFHKLQCYYSITLQIASFIALYGPSSTTESIKNPFDEAFLLLVSTNGIMPIAVTFYTLGLCDRLTLYYILLTSFSAILGSCTGIDIVRLLSKPHDSTEGTRFSDARWPAATGGLAPEWICGRDYEIRYPNKLKPEKVFLVGVALCDALIIGVIARWLATSFPGLFSTRCRLTRNGRFTLVERLSPSENAIRFMRKAAHVAAASILVWCTAMECFFFYQMLEPQYDRIVNIKDWGFGQIVGIAVWSVVIIDFVRDEVGSLCGISV